MADRWGARVEDLPPEEQRSGGRARGRLSRAPASATIVYTLAPERIVIGGGASGMPGLFPLLRRELATALGGYPGLPEHGDDDFVVPAALGQMAGPAGALILAEHAALSRHTGRLDQPEQVER